MKTIRMILSIMIISLFSNMVFAQVSAGISINVPSPRYFFLQDIEAYYDNQTSMYIYFSNRKWVHSVMLPSSFGYYDLNTGHKILIRDYHGSRPYNYIREHRSKFPRGYNDSPERSSWSWKERNNRGNKDFRRVPNNHNHELKRESHQDERKNENRGNGKGNRNNGKGNHKKK